ncbi:phosphoglycerate mutase family protein [Talaromyces stipitatus ATCC 10500]|uniref:Phosphoglycerate mutase family protein n=1 Tax=Talaromyces stipitatus (strain ATCC 10500 / CBS 375.48 / QM 6759 / NRRL 1006) TaxID=441959 RepID=B8MIQ3_TALSN|nr:phosphoglycerate mutase family protein [Talaromyces stipitatus ATCC 10500]EED15565.1 phosphoglycerate mutase family protein [Talaromyces stipitatus ATCC 10500]
MKIYLIRHAETVHNVGQAWAGTTDSALTNHGVLQIQRLATHFCSAAVKFEHVFVSDLTRAVLTAEGICNTSTSGILPIVTPLLREQHFGSREGLRIHASTTTASPPTVEPEPTESEASMRTRANKFLEEYLFPVLLSHSGDHTEVEPALAIVAHGIILRVLWNCLVHAFSPENVSYSPEVATLSTTTGGVLIPFWSNTGFMELSVHRSLPTTSAEVESLLSDWTMKILSVDNKNHLRDLRRTRGGIGSSQHDSKQRSIESFFKR